MSNPRLMRTELLLGSKGMSALQNSTIMIIGLGAVGGYALEAIARSGVGTLILVDFDSFDETNINRQILALSSTIGQKKTSVAAARVKEINPDCKVIIKDMYVDENSLPELMALKPDFDKNHQKVIGGREEDGDTTENGQDKIYDNNVEGDFQLGTQY